MRDGGMDRGPDLKCLTQAKGFSRNALAQDMRSILEEIELHL